MTRLLILPAILLLTACATPPQSIPSAESVTLIALNTDQPQKPTAAELYVNAVVDGKIDMRLLNAFMPQHRMSVEIKDKNDCRMPTVQVGTLKMNFDISSTTRGGDYLAASFVEDSALKLLHFGKVVATDFSSHVDIIRDLVQRRHNSWIGHDLPPIAIKQDVIKLADGYEAKLMTYTSVINNPFLTGPSSISDVFLVIDNLRIVEPERRHYDVFAVGTLEGYVGGQPQAETVVQKIANCLQYKPRFRPEPKQVASAQLDGG